MTDREKNNAILKAAEIVGSQAELARRLGVSTVAVWSWINREHYPNTDNCLKIERLTEGKVTLTDILEGKSTE